MDDISGFLAQYSLFGLGIVVLVPLLVQGVKGAYSAAFLKDMPAWAQILTVIIVCWALLAAHALVTYSPESVPYVQYALAGVLLPLSAMGLFSAVKAIVAK